MDLHKELKEHTEKVNKGEIGFDESIGGYINILGNKINELENRIIELETKK